MNKVGWDLPEVPGNRKVMYVRYISDKPEHSDEAGYTVQDGVILDPAGEVKPHTRSYNEMTRIPSQPTREELLAEEIAWAARSGPCYTIRPGHKVA